MRASPSDMQLFRAVAVVTWLSASGAVAQETLASTNDGFRWEAGLQLGYAFANEAAGGEHEGIGGRLQLLARFNDYFAVGTELAAYTGAGAHNVDRSGEYYESVGGLLVQVTTLARLGYDRGILRHAVVAGPAVSTSKEHSGVFTFLGLETTLELSRFPVVFDVRYFKPLTDSREGNPNYLTFGLGTRV